MKTFFRAPPFIKSAAEVVADIIEFARNKKYADEYMAMLS